MHVITQSWEVVRAYCQRASSCGCHLHKQQAAHRREWLKTTESKSRLWVEKASADPEFDEDEVSDRLWWAMHHPDKPMPDDIEELRSRAGRRQSRDFHLTSCGYCGKYSTHEECPFCGGNK